MSKVMYDMSMSLDGFVRASNPSPEEPLGKGGEQLHDWGFASDDDRDRAPLTDWVAGVGAVICGRRTYDDSLPWWKADGPTGSRRLPMFIVTHSQPEDVPAGSVYTFVTDGVRSALEQARAAAPGKDVSVMGPDVGRQFLTAGLVDEIVVHLVPVLFGSGLRMFDNLGEDHIKLEVIASVQTRLATHLRYRVVRQPA